MHTPISAFAGRLPFTAQRRFTPNPKPNAPPLIDADLFGCPIFPEQAPAHLAPSAPFAWYAAPLGRGRPPFAYDRATRLAERIRRERAGRAIRVRAEQNRPFGHIAALEGVAVYLLDSEGSETAVLGWAWMGGGRHAARLLQDALFEIDPPQVGELAGYEEAA